MRPRAKDLRKSARTNLKKRHWWAVLLTFITVWLGGTTFLPGLDPISGLPSGPTYNFDFSTYGFDYDFGSTDPFYYHSASMPGFDAAGEAAADLVLLFLLPMMAILITMVIVISVLSTATIFTGGPIRLGYSRWCLQMHDADSPRPFATLFSGFRMFGKGMGLYWWIYLKVFLWSLIAAGAMLIGAGIGLAIVLPRIETGVFQPDHEAFFAAWLSCIGIIFAAALLGSIPAFIAQYRYCMAYYLMIENPNLRVTEAVRCSIELMKGNKWRLFCLNLSFIGWTLLDLCTFGLLGCLYLNPYREFAVTAFYRDLVPAAPVSQMWNTVPPAPDTWPQVPPPQND